MGGGAVDFLFGDENSEGGDKTGVAPPHVVQDQLRDLLVRFFLILVCKELLERNKYGVLVAWGLEILGSQLRSTNCYFASKISLDIGVGRNSSRVTNTSLLKNVVNEVVIIVIISASVSEIGKRH